MFAVGVVLVGVGVSALLVAQLGVSPFDVANSGLARQLGVDVGTASWVVSAGLVSLAWLAGRRPRAGTVVSGFGVGLVINLCLSVLPAAHGPVRGVLAVVGLVVIWAGITAQVCADLGAGPAEELMLALVARGLGIREARWGIEAGLFFGGWLAGGAVGVFSVVFVLTTGPVLAHVVPRASALLGLHPTAPPEGAPAEMR